jgi:hypothetical protein
MATAAPTPTFSVNTGGSLLARARNHDQQAIVTMFRQFIPADEQIHAAEFLGTQGLWGVGTHSFACVTGRRFATLRVRLLGEVVYEDAMLENVNSGGVSQPSRLLFIPWFAGWFLPLILIGWRIHPAVLVVLLVIGVALLPVVIRLFYRLLKCGIQMWVASRERRSIAAFSDRKLLGRANAVYRVALTVRESRVKGAAVTLPALAAERPPRPPEPQRSPAQPLASFPPPVAVDREGAP